MEPMYKNNYHDQMVVYKNLLNGLICEKDTMTAEKKMKKEAHLSSLSKEIITIDGDEDFKSMVNRQLDSILSVKPGRKLIKELWKKNHKITIDLGVSHTAGKHKSGESNVTISKADPGAYLTVDKQFEHCSYPWPSWVPLAHELIHVLNYAIDPAEHQRNLKATNPWDVDIIVDMTNLEEQKTIIGFNAQLLSREVSPKKTDVLCENAFLLALGLPPRIGHISPPNLLPLEGDFYKGTDSKEFFFSWLEHELTYLRQIPEEKKSDKKYIQWFITRNPQAFSSLPEEYKNDDFILPLIMFNGAIAKYFPDQMKDKNFILKLIALNEGENAQEYRKNLLSASLWIDAAVLDKDLLLKILAFGKAEGPLGKFLINRLFYKTITPDFLNDPEINEYYLWSGFKKF